MAKFSNTGFSMSLSVTTVALPVLTVSYTDLKLSGQSLLWDILKYVQSKNNNILPSLPKTDAKNY